jgi:hypothetical protein
MYAYVRIRTYVRLYSHLVNVFAADSIFKYFDKKYILFNL